MALLTLGDLELDGFEVPSTVKFGGSQRAVVHRLLGGARVIDTMGRDDAVLVWSGILSGSGATGRARTLDAMRAGGAQVGLAWDAFCYNVVITTLDFEYCSPWWITYKIGCTVVSDLAQASSVDAASVADVITTDVSTAAAYIDLTAVVGALSAPGALALGAAAIAPTIAQLSSVRGSYSAGIAAAGDGLSAASLPSIVNAAGTLAQLCYTRGFVERAIANLKGLIG